VRSQEFDNAAWTKTNSTVTANATTAPDGTTTAEKVIADNANNIHQVDQSVTIAASTTYTFSAHVKKGEYDFAAVITGASGGAVLSQREAVINLTTGALVSETVAGMTRITALANGWYRVAVTTAQTSGTGAPGFRIAPLSTSSYTSYTGDGTSGIFIWGAQLEAASFPSSYIPTVAAAATRAADSLSISDARSAPFTMFAEFEPVGTANQNDIIAYDTLTNGNGIYLTPTPAAWVRESSVTTAIAPGGGAAVVGSVSRVAARFAVNDTLLCNAGTLGSADTSNSPPSTTVLKFAPSIFGGVQSVYLRRVAIIASGATNAQLQAMTT
jgi:hypothetical protein